MVNESDVSGNAVQHTPCQDTWNIVITCSQQCRHLKKAAASSFIIFKCVSWAQQHSSVPLTTTTTPTKLCVVMGCLRSWLLLGISKPKKRRQMEPLYLVLFVSSCVNSGPAFTVLWEIIVRWCTSLSPLESKALGVGLFVRHDVC